MGCRLGILLGCDVGCVIGGWEVGLVGFDDDGVEDDGDGAL